MYDDTFETTMRAEVDALKNAIAALDAVRVEPGRWVFRRDDSYFMAHTAQLVAYSEGREARIVKMPADWAPRRVNA